MELKLRLYLRQLLDCGGTNLAWTVEMNYGLIFSESCHCY